LLSIKIIVGPTVMTG